MHCTNCGQLLPDKAARCPSCGHPVYQFGAPPVIPNYLVQSVLVTMCCCLPLGIVALVYAAQVNGKLATGDVAGAQVASRKARFWCWFSFGAGLLSSILYAIIVIFRGFEDF